MPKMFRGLTDISRQNSKVFQYWHLTVSQWYHATMNNRVNLV